MVRRRPITAPRPALRLLKDEVFHRHLRDRNPFKQDPAAPCGVADFGAEPNRGKDQIPKSQGLANPFQTSIALTGLTFFAIGAAKSRWSLAPWWRSGLETLAIGGAAAAIAYFAGTLFRH